jgi:hypothetical protein
MGMNRMMAVAPTVLVVALAAPLAAQQESGFFQPHSGIEAMKFATSSDCKPVDAMAIDVNKTCASDSEGASGSGGTGGQSDTPSKPALSDSHKLGPLDITVNYRFRSESWDWFTPSTGENSYTFEHSLLRVGIGQKRESFEWKIEGAQDAILNLPTDAVQSGRLGQLGAGGSYYAANGSIPSTASGFLKQAYLAFNLPAHGNVKFGRFTFLDGAEVKPRDKTVETLVNTRIAARLIGDFGFTAVQRSYDGMQLSFDAGKSNFTLFGARPTQGVYQIHGMGELDISLFYGSYTVPVKTRNNAGELRVFAIGYMDDRYGVLKTDNRSTAARTADTKQIRIGTYGADYVHVVHTPREGQFDFLVWGALQNGEWGMLTQRASAFVGEAGWQPPVRVVNPWFSAGYSFGSGDSNPNDNVHGTFFQILPTPRPYARFPFYNMMNNEDFYGSAAFRLPKSLALRSELHALRLANAQDLWYGGGGAFQTNSFGYTGRAANGNRSLANVSDVSLDVPLPYGFSITTYYAHAWGKSLIASIYPGGTNGQFGYVEMNYHF